MFLRLLTTTNQHLLFIFFKKKKKKHLLIILTSFTGFWSLSPDYRTILTKSTMTSLTTGLQLCITFLHFSFKNIRSVVGMFEWVSRFNNASKWFDIDIIIFLISIRIMCLYSFVHLPHLILLFSSSFF